MLKELPWPINRLLVISLLNLLIFATTMLSSKQFPPIAEAMLLRLESVLLYSFVIRIRTLDKIVLLFANIGPLFLK